jgi:hypothetical protein
VAPLPRLLLGADRPARAFIGHVEPTFDWTVQDPVTKQYQTDDLTRGVYEGFYQAKPEPVGLAMRSWFNRVGSLAIGHELEVQRRASLDYAAWYQLAMRDRSTMVILGDPCVIPRTVGGQAG